MNTLSNHTLIYDDECPACRAYTQLFVDCHMIEEVSRQPYSKMLVQLKENIDWVRASNEIALVNHHSGEVIYGIDSLFTIIEKRIPFLAVIFRLSFFRFLIKKLYFFISFNRKVIMPGKQAEYCSSCAPSMNYPYRVAYIIFSWLLTSFILAHYAQLLSPLIPASNFGREFLFCGGQLLFQGALVLFLYPKRLIYYLGHLMTVSLAGAIALVPVLLLSFWLNNAYVSALYFGLVVIAMLVEHIKRVRLLQLTMLLSASWVVYRLILLLIIFEL